MLLTVLFWLFAAVLFGIGMAGALLAMAQAFDEYIPPPALQPTAEVSKADAPAQAQADPTEEESR